MIRVLIVDDSRVQRRAVVAYLESLPGFEVVGEAIDGLEGVQQAHALRPNVILMDVKMPRLDGLEATRRIMADLPTPILLMTTAENISLEVDLGMRALECGALDLVSKPNLDELKGPDTIIANRLQLLAGIPVIRHPAGRGRDTKLDKEASRKTTGYFRRAKRVVAIVASTGGPKALTTLLSGLPEGLKAAVVIVQHIDAAFEQGLVRWLDEHCPLDVVLASDGMELFESRVYLAPQGRQAELSERRCIHLVEEAIAPGRHSPSGDRLLSSAAESYGPKAIGCVLTGIGRDGADGLLALRKAGGVTIAQDEASSVVYGMPQAATRNGGALRVLPLSEIATCISEVLR